MADRVGEAIAYERLASADPCILMPVAASRNIPAQKKASGSAATMPSVLSRAAVAVTMCWLSACTTSPMSVVGNFRQRYAAPRVWRAEPVERERCRIATAPAVPPDLLLCLPGRRPADRSGHTDVSCLHRRLLDQQQAALVGVERNRWIEVAQAGEKNIDLICAQYPVGAGRRSISIRRGYSPTSMRCNRRRSE